MNVGFSVQANTDELYSDFIRVCEKQGWIHNTKFTDGKLPIESKYNCLYFSNNFDNKYRNLLSFASSDSDIVNFNLESQWGLAINHMQDI